MITKHMWEVKHPHYCNDANYYSNECLFEYKSWSEFLSEMGYADLDCNLFFRWDWREEDMETGECTFNGDNYYRNGMLKLYIMQQSKGRFMIAHVAVCRTDEYAVKQYLMPRLEYLKSLWEPLSHDEDTTAAHEAA